MIHDLRIHAHELLSGSAEGIKRASFDEVFNRALIQIFFIRLHSGQKIVQIMKRTTLRTLCNNRIDNRTPYTFDSSECIADRLYCFTGSIGIIGYGKTRTAFIDIRRQQMNAHAAAGSNITGNLWRIINDGGHQCCHKFYRIIMFEPGCLDGNNSVTGCMWFIKCIFCKIHHGIIDLIGCLFWNAFGLASRNAFRCISVDKILPFHFHDMLLLLTHGTAYKISTSEGITAQLLYDLHNLFLIYNTTIGRGENRLQKRCGIGDIFFILFAGDILRNEIHRARAIQRNAGNDIFQGTRL